MPQLLAWLALVVVARDAAHDATERISRTTMTVEEGLPEAWAYPPDMTREPVTAYIA